MRAPSGVRGAVLVVLVALGVRAQKIYFPTDIEKLRTDIAILKCLEDPNCLLPSHLVSGNRCKGGGETKEMIDKLKNRINLTTRSGGGGGGGGVCSGVAGEVVWPATGECVELLTQGPCPPGQWVQLLKTTYEPVCRSQPCEIPLEQGGGPGVLIGEDCFPPSQLPQVTTCPTNLVNIANEHGELECDCPPGLIYYPGDDTCYEPYTRGPCSQGWIIRVKDEKNGTSGEARCVPNECPEEGMVSLEEATCRLASRSDNSSASNCYQINSTGPCEDGNIITVDEVLAEPICLTTHSIFSPVTIYCPRGTFRDRDGRCRSTFDSIMSNIPVFRSSAGTPTRTGGLCGPGEFFAGGTCIQILG
ncbi:uncharacterized protein LOC127010140 [Eriocheir sinensis]|uniref:uncharacterized protein LOC127010140 n=1 Tax=Eriocheir sinensis TaxID=95602 RepID=UPI0021C7C933|nr:uncharacterized protein LOC127010140 [Eriocheir sinensis]